jgi:glycosyltransferase involved in cell wall biosynthesis
MIADRNRIPNSPPRVFPVDKGRPRPLFSVMIPCYNCSAYLIEAIRSVLIQDPGPQKMEIEVVDDHSTDTNVEALVNYIGKGRVKYYRQPYNVGSLRNFETCLNRSSGHYVHLLHGDDLVKPGFYAEIEKVFNQFPEAGAVFTGHSHITEYGSTLYHNKELMDKPGILDNWLHEIGREQLVQPPSMVVKRSVYEHLGSFFAVHYGEDWEMWVRIAANYPVAHTPERLALYRVHNNNITSKYFLSGQSMTDIETVININQLHFPKAERRRLRVKARRHFSRYFARVTDKIYHEYHQPEIALRHARRALRMNFNPTTLFFLIKIEGKMFLHYGIERERKFIYKIANYLRLVQGGD